MTAALPQVMSPEEWLGRLGPALTARQDEVELWRRYYEGDQNLPTGPSQVKAAYRKFQKFARTNLCELAVESMVDRMEVTGYRDKDGLDEEIWNLWTGARMAGRQYSIYRKALSMGAAYVIVGVDPRDSKSPRITIESPENVIVEHDPADPGIRLAALRLWHDSIRQKWFATVYVPGWRYHFQSRTDFANAVVLSDDARLSFDPKRWEQWTEPTRSAPEIPVIPYYNGDEGSNPMAEFAGPGIDIQDRLNLSVLNRLTAERFGAFRQKALTNYVPEEDPASGLPIAPFNLGVDQILTVPPPAPGEPIPELKDMAQTQTSDMIRGCEQDMRAFAAATRTPVYYLPGGDMVNLSADAIAALDSGHISKVKQRMSLWTPNHQEVLQLCADVAGVDREITQGAISWSKPENFHWAVVGDYVVKMKSAGVPLTVILEDIGWDPARIEQVRAEMAAETMLQAIATESQSAGSSPSRTPAAGAQSGTTQAQRTGSQAGSSGTGQRANANGGGSAPATGGNRNGGPRR